MPLKLSVGLQKKLGLPDYGSLGASCHVECELDASLLSGNPDQFQQHVRRAYVACAQAVNDELTRQQTGNSAGPAVRQTATKTGPNGSSNGGTGGRGGNGNGARAERPATQSQVRAIRAIASRCGLDLTPMLRSGFGVDSLELLSIGDASRLIDELKQGASAIGGRS
jgi:hypothetical protein